MKWFKHDSSANRDAKLKRLVMAYGMEGYGLFWYCLEQVASNVTSDKYTFELEHDAEIIAFDTGLSREKVEKMMSLMVDLGLFENNSGTITCLKLSRRIDQSMTSNPEMRKIIQSIKNHDPVMTESGESHDPIMTESEQIRLDKIRLDKNTRRFTPPSVEEVAEKIKEMGYKHSDAETFCNFYGSKNWMVGKNKMSDWAKALGGWESRQRNESDKTNKTRQVYGI